MNRKYLVMNLTVRNLKLRYRNSWLGGIWTVLLPAGSALIYYFVFSFVIRVKTEHYLSLVLSGTLCWTYFASSLNGSMETIVQNVRLLNKVPLPPQALIYADILTNLTNLLFALPTLILVMFASGVGLHWQMLLMPFLFLLLTLQITGFGLFLGISNAYFRDLRHLMVIIIQIWFYLTPVLYALNRWPAEYQWALYLNPLSFLFEGLHVGLIGSGEFGSERLAIATLWSVGVFVAGLVFLVKTRDNLIEAL